MFRSNHQNRVYSYKHLLCCKLVFNVFSSWSCYDDVFLTGNRICTIGFRNILGSRRRKLRVRHPQRICFCSTDSHSMRRHYGDRINIWGHRSTRVMVAIDNDRESV